MLSRQVYPFKEMADLNWPSKESKVQLAPPKGNIYGI